MLLELCQGVVLLLEALVLGGLPAKGPDDPHAGEVLPGGAQHLVQARLHLLVPGHGPQHHAEHHHRQQGDGHHEHQRRGHVEGKGHHHGAKHHKGGAQQQPQGQVQAVLHLVDVAGHAGDKGGGAHGVHLGVAQGLDVGEQVVPQLGGNAHRGLGREELGGDGAHQAHHAQAGHHQAHAAHIAPIGAGNAHVDDSGHHQGNQQLEGGLQQLEQRPQDALLLIAAHIGK